MIICSTDGSLRSMHALPHAAYLAETLGQRLNLVQVFDPSAVTCKHGPDEARRLQDEIHVLKASMRLLLTEIGVQPETECRALLKGESVADAILNEAAETQTRLIAMDTHGHRALRHALLGSVAMDVLARSPMPVMMTGPEVLPPHRNGRYLVLATYDGSPGSELVFESLRRLDCSRNLSIVIAWIYTPALGDRAEEIEVRERCEKLEALIRQYLSGPGCETIVRTAPEFATPEMTIAGLANELQADAIAMSTRGYDAGRHLLLGSVADGLLTRSHVPLILTPA
ncbi:MAG: universal stress protein [Dehalococcoidia bacterium]